MIKPFGRKEWYFGWESSGRKQSPVERFDPSSREIFVTRGGGGEVRARPLGKAISKMTVWNKRHLYEGEGAGGFLCLKGNLCFPRILGARGQFSGEKSHIMGGQTIDRWHITAKKGSGVSPNRKKGPGDRNSKSLWTSQGRYFG